MPAIIAAAAVLSAAPAAAPGPLAQDKGASGAWQQLLKLQTTASAMHTTAHPDDEQGGVLAQLSRGRGARVALMTLTRGESGDNAIGTELFDAVGLIRTEELLLADRYYGVDRQYFTSAVDYGFSKRLDEALEKWGRENVLRDIVGIIRMDRPFVLISRFQGNERDGHGNHQAAGLLTQEAYRIAGDPSVFPEQITEGLRAWQPLKLYMGGVREDESWTLRADASEFSPWLGDSYQAFARLGLSFQRSQNGGRVAAPLAPAPAYFRRLAAVPELSVTPATVTESSFFEGIDTTVPGLFKAIRRPEPPGADALLNAIATAVTDAVKAFSIQNPSASVPALARGLAATRRAIERLSAEPDAVFILRIKEEQFAAAIDAALGIDLEAIASVPGPVVPGQRLPVAVSFTNGGSVAIDVDRVDLLAASDWRIERVRDGAGQLRPNGSTHAEFSVIVPDAAPVTRPHFERSSLAESRYTIREGSKAFRPFNDPPLSARVRYAVDGASIETRAVVRRRESHLPYGEALRELMVVPPIAVNVMPRQAVVPLDAARKTVVVRVELLNNDVAGSSGELTLRLPPGWTAAPERASFSFPHAAERAVYTFTVNIASAATRAYRIDAIATIGGRTYSQGYDTIEHRDLETRYLYHAAMTEVRGVDVAIAPNLKVGYVMGIGDAVPDGIAQLGASVTLLNEPDLARGDLSRYDAIVTGTRAYAVRNDLRTHNRRLLDYVKDGGNLIVLYNTQELVPDDFAPYPGELTAQADEVSEEDSPVEILAPADRVLNVPNRITRADFDGWVEQRGSKFWSSWDAAYTPIIATHDTGQPAQRGGWLTAQYGKGHYTYFAYALHRQLPYAVPGAYRLLANLLSQRP